LADPRDPIEEFAKTSGLQIATTELNAAPRDLVAPPDEQERYRLAELRREGDECALRMLFLSDAASAQEPSIRDILWWLASDAWAIEHAGRDLNKWRSALGYADSEATARIFRLQSAQTEKLIELLGDTAYRDLLSRYSAQLSPR
jgi:hypothetical protein